MSSLRNTAVAVLCTTVLAACGGGGEAGSADTSTAGGVAVKSLSGESTGTVSKSSGTTTTAAVAATAVTAVPAGRLLASNCFQCHGTNGQSTAGFDKLVGMTADELYKKVKEMQTSTEENGIMRIHALGYSDDQIRGLAGYFASQPH